MGSVTTPAPQSPAAARPTRPAKPVLEDVLAQRYASPEMVAIWAPENKIVAERRLWLAVLRAQGRAGLTVDPQVLADYEAVIEQVRQKVAVLTREFPVYR